MTVVHCRNSHFDVLIDRTSKWGNPFYIGRDGTRSEVIAKYRVWLLDQPKLMSELRELRGKILGCWCRPKKCHGDVLSALVNAPRSLFISETVNIDQHSALMELSMPTTAVHDDEDDDDDDDEIWIKGLSRDRTKLMASKGVPGQDMMPRKLRIPVSENLVKMEPNIPRVMPKAVVASRQFRNLQTIMAHPLKSNYTLGIGSFPSDLRAKYLAITIMNAAIDEHVRLRKPGRSMPLWHRVYGGLGDNLRDKPIQDMPSMLIISNLNGESSNFKLEKVRDLLEKFSEIPRIVISGGEPPVDLFANRLHYQLRYGLYLGPSNRIQDI